MNSEGKSVEEKKMDTPKGLEAKGVASDEAKSILREAFASIQNSHDGPPSNPGALRLLRVQLEKGGELSQQKLAEDFFAETIGKRIDNNLGAYRVYQALKGTPFAERFKELEDKRLKDAGYGGFNL